MARMDTGFERAHLLHRLWPRCRDDCSGANGCAIGIDLCLSAASRLKGRAANSKAVLFTLIRPGATASTPQRGLPFYDFAFDNFFTRCGWYRDTSPLNRLLISRAVASKNIVFVFSAFASCEFCALPFELSINSKLKRYVSVAKPTVDAKQLKRAAGANCP